jgi:Tfp pilus assembly protein PilX
MTRPRQRSSTRRPVAPPGRQRGFVLLIAMLLLTLMMVVGSASLETALVEHKVAASLRDRSASFEGAEAGALQSFARLRQLIATGSSEPTVSGSGGLYYGGQMPSVFGGTFDVDNVSLQFWRSWKVDGDLPQGASIRTTLPESIPHVAKTSYVIERLPIDEEGEPSSPNTYPLNYSRFTVFGKGEAAAEVLIQTTLVTLPK